MVNTQQLQIKTTFATANDGSVGVVLGVTGFLSMQTNKAVMTETDGNQMDTESFLASLHVIATAAIKDVDGKQSSLLVKKFHSV
jgi:hypothetical protein